MRTWQKLLIIAALAPIIVVAGTITYFQYLSKRRLIISTTTSLYVTGLWDEIELTYEATHNIDLNIVSAGTGIAIEHAENGNADLIVVHSPSMEQEFLENGYGVCRKVIAYNFFTIVGPSSDLAGINGLNITEALTRIIDYGRDQSTHVWISRGDNSGTHSKEKELWATAGFDYTSISSETSWYASVGSGMANTLNVANQKSAYTLSDIGTYLKFSTDGTITLTALITEEESLLNVYSVMVVNQTRHQHVNFDDAIEFIEYLVSNEGQTTIENYGKVDFTQSLFYGAVGPLNTSPSSQISQWIQSYAFFNGTECPWQYRNDYPELYN
ncbi:MAG: substrate-binding domain-containing protein [Candidatus Bathyarchaeota archaeon]|nr:MAG: substrate-binding domain-containing protein [Candidatus Bathyarchaeota archaeon]